MCLALTLSMAACGNTPAESSNSSNDYLESDIDSITGESAVTLYQNFLSGKAEAVVEKENGQNESLSVYQMYGLPLEKSIRQYAFWDINGDTVPELLIESDTFCIFTIVENSIRSAYTELMGYEQTDMLSNGALLAVHHSTGTMYRYTVIDKAGKPSTIEFFDAESDATDAPYSFEEKENITKQEFEALTEKYMELSKNKANIKWKKLK